MDFRYKLRRLTDKEIYDIGVTMPYDKRLLFEYRIVCCKNHEIYIPSLAKVMHETIFIKKLVKNNELNYIINNIETIIGDSLISKEELLKYLNCNKDKLNDDILNKIYHSISNCIFKNSSNPTYFYDLLESICEKEKVTLLNIQNKIAGSYSKIYQIGNTILKVGDRRGYFFILDNSYILLPQYRGYVDKYYVEITDCLDTSEKFTDEDVYSVYKALREEGVLWLDPKANNLARINERALNNQKERNYHKDYLGIMPNLNHQHNELQVGDLVIIDLDLLINENDLRLKKSLERKINSSIVKKTHEYEKRYQYEREGKVYEKRFKR